jgi:hypothetical protein
LDQEQFALHGLFTAGIGNWRASGYIRQILAILAVLDFDELSFTSGVYDEIFPRIITDHLDIRSVRQLDLVNFT